MARKLSRQMPARRIHADAPPLNPILRLGTTANDIKLLESKLKSLPYAGPTGLHGELQVMLSAARRIEADLRALIEIEEGGAG